MPLPKNPEREPCAKVPLKELLEEYLPEEMQSNNSHGRLWDIDEKIEPEDCRLEARAAHYILTRIHPSSLEVLVDARNFGEILEMEIGAMAFRVRESAEVDHSAILALCTYLMTYVQQERLAQKEKAPDQAKTILELIEEEAQRRVNELFPARDETPGE